MHIKDITLTTSWTKLSDEVTFDNLSEYTIINTSSNPCYIVESATANPTQGIIPLFPMVSAKYKLGSQSLYMKALDNSTTVKISIYKVG